MGHILLLAILLYGYGDAGFDGHRPAQLDRPLRNFHRAVDAVARDAQRILVTIDSNAKAIASCRCLATSSAVSEKCWRRVSYFV
jgi:hypothetical protein